MERVSANNIISRCSSCVPTVVELPILGHLPLVRLQYQTVGTPHARAALFLAGLRAVRHRLWTQKDPEHSPPHWGCQRYSTSKSHRNRGSALK